MGALTNPFFELNPHARLGLQLVLEDESGRVSLRGAALTVGSLSTGHR